MKLVAVIDLLGGRVVHARRGDRACYSPINSTLCDGSEPQDIARALLGLYPFDAIYVADLDAIQRGDVGTNAGALRSIAASAATSELWIDAGVASVDDVKQLGARIACVPVVGSESIASDGVIEALRQGGHRFVLSLDFRGSQFLGPTRVLEYPESWPDQVLAMNLLHVGSSMGADLPLIERLHRAAPGKQIFASGGIRSASDLDTCASCGASGALLATCLHDGRMTAYLSRHRAS